MRKNIFRLYENSPKSAEVQALAMPRARTRKWTLSWLMTENLTIKHVSCRTFNAPSPIKGRGSLPMSKTTDIILCVVYSALLCGMGWLFVKASQLEPQTSEVATLAQARPVKPIIFHILPEEAIDRTIICGGGGDDKLRGPTELAGEPVHRC